MPLLHLKYLAGDQQSQSFMCRIYVPQVMLLPCIQGFLSWSAVLEHIVTRWQMSGPKHARSTGCVNAIIYRIVSSE